MSKRKYRPGRKVRSANELVRLVMADHYVYLRHKPQHPGWVRSLQLNYLIFMIEQGEIRRAELL